MSEWEYGEIPEGLVVYVPRRLTGLLSDMAKEAVELDQYHEFKTAIDCNHCPIPQEQIKYIEVIVVGERDGGPWVWKISDSEQWFNHAGKTFIGVGTCDYTGWDCQSGIEWYAPHEGDKSE